MASAPPARLDPVVSLAPAPAADETLPPPPSLAAGPLAAAAEGVEGAAEAATAKTGATATPSGFPLLGLTAAVAAHALAAVAFYALMLHQPPEEAKAPADLFEIVLTEDMAGRTDGIAPQAPDGAPPPDVLQEPDARAPTPPADEPTADPVTTPDRPTQPPSFDAQPMPPAPPPVPTTADAWTPKVAPSLAMPLPPAAQEPADLQTSPTTEPAKPEPAPKTAAPARPAPPAPAPAPPAPPPSAKAAAPPVPSRPSLQRSLDMRDIAGRAPTRNPAAGSSSGNAAEASYTSLLYRALDRVRFYPVGSRARQEEGRVVLRVTIAADGRLLDAFIVSGSGFPDLDAATMEMARRAAPYPPLPSTLGTSRASFNVPVIFGIRRL